MFRPVIVELKSIIMKKSNLWAVCCLFAVLSACSDSDPEVLKSETLYPVQFSIRLTEEVIPIPQTRVMPPLNIPEPIAKAEGESKEIHSLCNTIEYIVFEEGDTENPIRRTCFEYAENNLDFGIINDSLPLGNYQIAFLAYNSCETALEGTIMSFNKVTDTFYALSTQEIEAKEIVKENIVLRRAVGKIEFVSTDKVPDEAKDFSMTIHNYPSQLNVLTGQGVIPAEGEDPVLIHSFTQEEKGVSGLTHSFFTFVPESETIEVDLATKDTEGLELRSRTVSGISPVANHIIRYTGRLYTYSPSDNEFTITIENDGIWAGETEHELND